MLGLLNKATLRHWDRAASLAEHLDIRRLKALRQRARALGRRVDRVIAVADARLAAPAGSTAAIRRPMLADWAWRPDVWSGPVKPFGVASVKNDTAFGDQVTIFHDCDLRALSVRQVQAVSSNEVAPHGLALDVFQFRGTFLSVVIKLPPEGIKGLHKQHIFRLDVQMKTEKPLDVFARLNVSNCPNVAQISQQFDGSSGARTAEFDLAHSALNESLVQRAWVDLIFKNPQMNAMTLHDVTMSRRLRAEF